MKRVADWLVKINGAGYPFHFVFFLIIGLALYHTSFDHGWTYDDWQVIVQNPDITSFGNFLKDSYSTRPLRELSYMLDRLLFGMSPRWWHLQNIFLHSFNAFLVFCLAKSLSAKRQVAWFASLLFLVHPVQVEVVANLSHRKDSLALAFCLLSMLLFLKAFHSRQRKTLLFLLSFVSWLIAFSAKENAIVIPILWVAYAKLFAVPGKYKSGPRHYWLVVILPAGVLISFFYAYKALFSLNNFYAVGGPLLEKYAYYGPVKISVYYMMMLKSWAFLLSKLLWPLDLGVEYLYSVPTTVFDPWVLFGVLIVFILLFAFNRLRKISPVAIFYLSWFALFWLPTSNLWPSAYFAADRYLYTPSVGLFLLLGHAVANAKVCHGMNRYGLQFALLIPLILLSYHQNEHWKTDETLYLHSLKVSPKSAFICNELGKYYYQKRDVASSLKYFRQGEDLDPNKASILYNLGNLYASLNMTDKAGEYYCRFLALDLPKEYIPFARRLMERNLECRQK